MVSSMPPASERLPRAHPIFSATASSASVPSSFNSSSVHPGALPGHPLKAGILRLMGFVVTALGVRPSFSAMTLSRSVPRSASWSGVHPPRAGVYRGPGRSLDSSARAPHSSSVHSFTFWAAVPRSAAPRIARSVPFVVVTRPPNPNVLRQRHTTAARAGYGVRATRGSGASPLLDAGFGEGEASGLTTAVSSGGWALNGAAMMRAWRRRLEHTGPRRARGRRVSAARRAVMSVPPVLSPIAPR